jgi:hypothetical protein
LAVLRTRTEFSGRGWKFALASVIMMAAGFATDRAFTHQVKVHAQEMEWAVGDADPLRTGAAAIEGQTKVIVFRRSGGVTCYDSFYSNEVAQRLQISKGRLIRVEYNVFYNFGQKRACNVRSVDGQLINEGMRPVIHTAYDTSGKILEGSVTGACDRQARRQGTGSMNFANVLKGLLVVVVLLAFVVVGIAHIVNPDYFTRRSGMRKGGEMLTEWNRMGTQMVGIIFTGVVIYLLYVMFFR